MQTWTALLRTYLARRRPESLQEAGLAVSVRLHAGLPRPAQRPATERPPRGAGAAANV